MGANNIKRDVFHIFNFKSWQEILLNDNVQNSLYLCIWSNVKLKKRQKKPPCISITLAYNSTNQNDSTVFDQFKHILYNYNVLIKSTILQKERKGDNTE